MFRFTLFKVFFLGFLCYAHSQPSKNHNQIAFQPTGPSIQTHRLFDDSLSSSFLIFVRDSVAEHFHRSHTEQVIILEGMADMLLGDKALKVLPGDIIYIPQGTRHSAKVTSQGPLKLISIQAPYFDGTDRVIKTAY